MNILKAISIVTGLALAVPAVAVDFTDMAQVVNSTQAYRQVSVPRQECWTESVPAQPAASERSNTGAIIGGVTGGIVGSEIGRGHGRDAAIAAGAIVGTIAGDRLDNQSQQQPATRQAQHCRTVNDFRQEPSGYTVTYRYAGREATVLLPHDPGQTVRVGVGVMQ